MARLGSETGDVQVVNRLDVEDVLSSRDDECRWLDVVARSMPRVRAYIRRMSQDGDELADLWAEARALAWSGRADLLADPCPIHVMIRYAREACRNRMVTRRHETRLDEVTVAMSPNQDSMAVDSMSHEEALERQRWSVRVLGRLSPQQRLAVDYRYRWSWDYDYVAAASGSTEAAARVNAHRGLRRLRAIIANDPPPLLAHEDG